MALFKRKRVRPGMMPLWTLLAFNPFIALFTSSLSLSPLTWGHFFIAFERGRERENHWYERETSIKLPFIGAITRGKPATQACALCESTLQSLVTGWCFNQLSHTSQGSFLSFLTQPLPGLSIPVFLWHILRYMHTHMAHTGTHTCPAGLLSTQSWWLVF